MKKISPEFASKSREELEKTVQVLRSEIAIMSISHKVKQVKDTNLTVKKKKRLAVALTLITQKKLGIK